MAFTLDGLSSALINAVTDAGYQRPTAIQTQAIPAVLRGDDVIATAQTGSGKTASFVLPILQRLTDTPTALRGKRIRALIVVPTRELAQQVHADIERYGKYLSVTSLCMVGGVDPEPQKQQLLEGAELLVATPGRLQDMARQRAVQFDQLEVLVLDEADRMLDMGFIDAIEELLERLPQQRQNLLFTATLNDRVRAIARHFSAAAIDIQANNDSTTPHINQWMVAVDKDTKSALLTHLLTEHHWSQALIFCEKKHSAAKLASQLEKRGIKAEAFHSGRSQAVRNQLMDDFKSGTLKYLIATGVVARGIDVPSLACVVNYDLPHLPDEYIHRIGRTGRAGERGEAVSLVSKDDFKHLCAIESRLGQLLDRREFAEFPVHKTVPVSILNYQPRRTPDNNPAAREQAKPPRRAHKAAAARADRKPQKTPREKAVNPPADKPTSGFNWHNRKK